MGFLATDNNQFTIIYNSDTTLGKQSYAYLQDTELGIHKIDTSKNNITSSQWTEVAEKLGTEIKDLINRDHPDFKQMYDSDLDLDATGWLNILDKHPELVQGAILLRGDECHHIINPSHITQHIEPTSGNVRQNRRHTV